MGVGGAGPHGLSIKTIEMTYDASTHRITRVNEAGIIFRFGPGVVDHSGIRLPGLKLGFRIRRAHARPDARMVLTEAAAAFRALEMPHWSRRTDTELAAVDC